MLHVSAEPKTPKQIWQEIGRDEGKLYPKRTFNADMNTLIVGEYIQRLERGEGLEPYITRANGRGHRLQSKIMANPANLRKTTSPLPPGGLPTANEIVRKLIAEIGSKR